jgi:hypothetical protein
VEEQGPRVTSERDILEYVNYAEEDERLESRVQVHRGVEAAIWLRAYVKGGAKRGALDPLECDADTLLSLIDRGYLTFQDGWFTITPAGKATLALDDEAELTQDG